jgi:CheY-like chemotaxis protein
MTGKCRVLIAEDNDVFGFTIRDYLEDFDFHVTLVKHVEGLKEHAHEADVIIVDVRLPLKDREPVKGQDGINAAADLVKKQIISPKVPVIFISVLGEDESGCQEELKKALLQPDRYCWLQKPIEMELLKKRIGDQLANLNR